MKFAEAYVQMLKGKKITRPCFKGHWFIDGVTGKMTIELADGNQITEGALDITVRNTLAEDWEIKK